MKKIFITAILLFSMKSYCQPWYSKIIDPFKGKQEQPIVMKLDGNNIWIRANTLCSSGGNLCSLIGSFSFDQNEFTTIKHFDEIQGSRKDLLVLSKDLFLASQESILNKNISLSLVSKSNLEYLNTIDLKIPGSRYFSYTIKNSIFYRQKLIIGAQALDSLYFINYQGWYNYQENALFFVLDTTLQLDTILIIPPSSGAFLKIEDMAVGPDSILYVSFYEQYFKSEGFFQIRKVIYGFDKFFNKIFQWIGPDFDFQESLSCLTVGTDTTIYINYKHDYRTYLLALHPDGTIKWECLLDSVIYDNLYNISKILIAENGDIIGAGIISSNVDELGESGFLFRVDSTGILKWKKAIRINKGFDLTVPDIFPFQTGLEDLVELPNRDLLAVGYVRNYVGDNQPDGPYDFDIWIVRTSPDGCLWDDCPYIQDVVTRRNYIPIVTPANEWVVDYYIPFFPDMIYRYTFSEDSVLIGGEYFHKLLASSGMTGPFNSTGRYFREENGKVYIYGDFTANIKTLLYDFDFGVGDTLATNSDGFNYHREIVQVGTTHLLDGIPRKFLTLECTADFPGADSTEWIEGMGDVDELFGTRIFCTSMGGDGARTAIRCFSTNGQLLYLRPGLEGCYTTGVNELEDTSFKVYPNPVSDIVHIETNIAYPVDKILIYNSVGKLMLTANQILDDSNLDVSSLTSGFYIGIIYFKNNIWKTFKIVIEK